jgi:hypothetical protein
LLSPEVDLNSLQNDDEKDDIMKNMEQEIACPRCYDIMTLSSDFDRLIYFCQACDLLLMTK